MLVEAVRVVSESVERCRVCEAAGQVGQGLASESLQRVSPSKLINTLKETNHTALRLNRRPQCFHSCLLHPTSWWTWHLGCEQSSICSHPEDVAISCFAALGVYLSSHVIFPHIGVIVHEWCVQKITHTKITLIIKILIWDFSGNIRFGFPWL